MELLSEYKHLGWGENILIYMVDIKNSAVKLTTEFKKKKNLHVFYQDTSLELLFVPLLIHIRHLIVHSEKELN